MGLRIDVLCHDGSPLGVTLKDIWGEGKRGVGVGGSELALLTMCESWAKRGDTVVLYNDPLESGASPFEQRQVADFEPEADRDILIIFRSPNDLAEGANGLRCWWSCDQYSQGNYARFAPQVHKIITISDFHSQHFKAEYGIRNAITIDLPVRVEDYTVSIPKVPGRCLFSSVPDRGLLNLWYSWPRIKRDIPEASLVITSDYRLWGLDHPHNEQYRLKFLDYRKMDVQFLGAVQRRQLIEEQLKAQIFPYPCIYDELFCIAAAEAQVAGAYPITSTTGALATTAMGMKIAGEMIRAMGEFNNGLLALLRDPDLAKKQEEVRQRALARFHPDCILSQWDEKIFKEG